MSSGYVLAGPGHGTVHRETCEHVGLDPREWVWARGKALEEVRDRVAVSRAVRACSKCDPLQRRSHRGVPR